MAEAGPAATSLLVASGAHRAIVSLRTPHRRCGPGKRENHRPDTCANSLAREGRPGCRYSLAPVRGSKRVWRLTKKGACRERLRTLPVCGVRPLVWEAEAAGELSLWAGDAIPAAQICFREF